MKEKYIKEYAISIKKFLRLYMGITDPRILDAKISHKDLKILNPHLKRLPYKYISSDMKQVLSGNVIIVIDDYGNYIPYEAPEAKFSIDTSVGYKENIDNCSIDKTEILMENELENLRPEQLSEICKEYKKANRGKDYNIAYRILRRKKQEERKSDKYMKGKGKI